MLMSTMCIIIIENIYIYIYIYINLKKVIEAVTVLNIGRGSLLFCYIYAKILKPVKRKSLLINVFNLNQVFLAVNFPIFDMFI